MDVFELINAYNAIFCLAIVALVWFQRKSAEIIAHKFKKDLNNYEVWKDLLVPLGPLGTGGFLSLIPQLSVPETFDGTINRFIFGIGMGLISGLVFRLIKKNIYDKMGKKDEETTYVDE